MKINSITTIVDLAFNLSGSLAGIPVILPQLPVGERVGFDTLPDVWEDVDDTGQTWTPDLDGVEVDITVEAYNPTAIQKAPYSTDMKCIDVASGWGNALLDVLESGDWYTIADVPTSVTYLDKIRIININEEVLVRTANIGTSQFFAGGVYVPPSGSNLTVDLAISPYPPICFYNLYLNSPNDERIIFGYLENIDTGVPSGRVVPAPDSAYGNVFGFEDLTPDWGDKSLGYNVTIHFIPTEQNLSAFRAPYDHGWSIESNVFVKIRG